MLIIYVLAVGNYLIINTGKPSKSVYAYCCIIPRCRTGTIVCQMSSNSPPSKIHELSVKKQKPPIFRYDLSLQFIIEHIRDLRGITSGFLRCLQNHGAYAVDKDARYDWAFYQMTYVQFIMYKSFIDIRQSDRATGVGVPKEKLHKH